MKYAILLDNLWDDTEIKQKEYLLNSWGQTSIKPSRYNLKTARQVLVTINFKRLYYDQIKTIMPLI